MSKSSTQQSLGIIALSLILPLAGPSAGTAGQTSEWRAYAADHAGTKYAPVSQINKQTVHDLQIVWRQSTVPAATRRGNTMRAPSASQNTPLMARGRLYISTGLGAVAAGAGIVPTPTPTFERTHATPAMQAAHPELF